MALEKRIAYLEAALLGTSHQGCQVCKCGFSPVVVELISAGVSVDDITTAACEVWQSANGWPPGAEVRAQVQYCRVCASPFLQGFFNYPVPNGGQRYGNF